jgi:adenylate cyclase
VLFADLKNFTKTVEHLSPPEAIQMLNRYLELMTQVIRDEYGGFVDKYLGDGLMAQWGAPELYPLADGTVPTSHAEVAVRACVELERRTRELTKSIRGGHDVTFGLRLTLHTGPVVYGWVGAERIELTVIGDTVNVCARLQETAKQLNCEFLVSETTFEEVRDWAQIGQEAEVEIRGRDQPLRVYEIAGQNGAQSTLMAANGEKGAYTVQPTRAS